MRTMSNEWEQEERERKAKRTADNDEAARIKALSVDERKRERSALIDGQYKPRHARFERAVERLKKLNKQRARLQNLKKKLEAELEEMAGKIDMLECPERRMRIYCELSGSTRAFCHFRVMDESFKCPLGVKAGDSVIVPTKKEG